MRNFGQFSGYGMTQHERRAKAIAERQAKFGGNFNKNGNDDSVDLTVEYAPQDITGCDQIVLGIAERAKTASFGAHLGFIKAAALQITPTYMTDFIKAVRRGENMGSYGVLNITPEEHYCMLAVQWFEHHAIAGLDASSANFPWAAQSQLANQVAQRWAREGMTPTNSNVTINAGSNSHEAYSVEMSNQGKAQLQAAANAGMHPDAYEAMLISQGKPIWIESEQRYVEYPYTGMKFQVNTNANANVNANSNSNGNNSNAAWYDDTTNVALLVGAAVVLGGAFWYIRQDKGRGSQRGSMARGYDQSMFNHPIINPFF